MSSGALAIRTVPALGALAAVAAALPVAPPAPVAAALLTVATLAAPGAGLAARLAPSAAPADLALLAIVLSPWLAALPAGVLLAAGAPPPAAARAALATWGALAPRAGRPALAPADRPLAAVAAGWAALVAAMFAGNAFLAPRSDGWFHGAVTLALATRGMPVEDPAFAGLPLLYFWGYHLWAAIWVATAPALAVWTPLVALNVASAAALALGVGAVARRLGAGPRGRAAAALLALFGSMPFGWALPVARAALGETRGAGELAAVAGAGAGEALRAMMDGTLHASLAFTGDKYLTLTPFALGLALFAALLAAWLDATRDPRVATLATLACVEGAALALHTVVGFAVLPALALWAIATLARRGMDAAERARGVVAVGLALAAALAVHAPYLLAVAGGKREAVGPGVSRAAVASLVWAGAALVPAGFTWLARARRAVPAAAALLPAALALALLGLSVRLPENNQSKFFNLLFVALAAPAALAYGAWLRGVAPAARRAAWATAALAVAPTAAFALWGFAAEHGREEESHHFPPAAAARGWTWLRGHTPADAVVADAEGASDASVLAARSALWGGGFVERDWGHAPALLEARRRAAREIGLGTAPSPGSVALLRGLRREVIAVARAEGRGDPASAWERLARAPGYALLYADDALAFWRWQGER